MVVHNSQIPNMHNHMQTSKTTQCFKAMFFTPSYASESLREFLKIHITGAYPTPTKVRDLRLGAPMIYFHTLSSC